jgi:hypothetical protein
MAAELPAALYDHRLMPRDRQTVCTFIDNIILAV